MEVMVLLVLTVIIFPTDREAKDDVDYKKMTLDILPNILQLLPKITTQRAGNLN